jgi:hypothetical protein
VETIRASVFSKTGSQALTIILPANAPQVEETGYYIDRFSKTVTIKTPAGRTGYNTRWETSFKKAFSLSATITFVFENL